jgi:hypothetical protein
MQDKKTYPSVLAVEERSFAGNRVVETATENLFKSRDNKYLEFRNELFKNYAKLKVQKSSVRWETHGSPRAMRQSSQ